MKSAKSTKVLILTIGNGINVLINFLTLPYLVRSLSFNDYGSYGQVLMIISLLQGIFTFNLNQISNVYLAQEQYKPSLVFSTLMRITVLMSLLGTIIMLISIPFIGNAFDNDAITKLLLLSLFNLLGQIPVPILISVLIYFGKVQHTTTILIVTNILKIGVMFFTIHFLGSVVYLMVGLSIVSIIQPLLLFFSIPKDIRRLNLFDKLLARKFFSMATPLAISSLIEKSLVYVDGVMISTLLTTTAYAFYRAGAVEVPFIATLYGAVTAIVMPEIAKLYTDKKFPEIVKLKRTAISGTVFFVYPVLIYLLFFASPLVSLYLSEKYSQSAIIFSIFNLSLLIRINDYQDIIIISGNSRFIFKSVLFVSVMNLLLNFFFIKWIGITGSAIAFIFSLLSFAGLLTWKSTKVMHCKFTDLFNVPLILKVTILSFILAGVVYLINHFIFNEILFIIVSAPIYFLLVFLLGLKFGLLPPALVEQLNTRLKKYKIKI